MRVLFIHATREDAVEYNVHAVLAEHADNDQITSYFIWQDRVHNRAKNRPAQPSKPGQTFIYDFGRDMSLDPRPGRVRRAAMMARQYPGALALVFTRVRALKPDLIYTSQQKFDVHLGRLASTVFRIPHVIHLHYPVGPWLGRAALRTILKTPRLIAVSEFIRRWAIDAGVAPQHVHTLLNPAEIDRFDRPKERAALRAELGWAPETPVILAAGRLDPSKGHKPLIEAFAQVVAQVPAARLLICGASSTELGYDRVLKELVAGLGLERHVVFAGVRSDMPAVFAGADIFCLPTEHEALGMVFLEAMASATPVVALDSGGVPEMVVDQETGLLAQPGDVDGLATHLLTLLRDPDLARKLGEAGKRRAFAEFHPRHVAARWTQLLDGFRSTPAAAQEAGRTLPSA